MNSIEECDIDNMLLCFECADYVYEYCSLHGPQLVIPDEKILLEKKEWEPEPAAVITTPLSILRISYSSIPDGEKVFEIGPAVIYIGVLRTQYKNLDIIINIQSLRRNVKEKQITNKHTFAYFIIGAGLGVFTTVALPRGVRFGPYQGIRTRDVKSSYCWQVLTSNVESLYLDAFDAYNSNWMRYVNCSRHWSEQNLVAFQYKRQIYYSTIKAIPRDTELLVYYGSAFANALNIDLRHYNKPSYFSEMGDYVNHLALLNEDKKHNYESNSLEPLCSKGNDCITKSRYMRYRCSTDANMLCTYSTNNLRNIRRHEALHLNYKPFQCSVCDYKTKIYHYLKQHMSRIHNAEREKYLCTECIYKTHRKEQLRLHKLTHLPYDPIVCVECGFKTNNFKNLNKHVKTQHLRKKERTKLI